LKSFVVLDTLLPLALRDLPVPLAQQVPLVPLVPLALKELLELLGRMVWMV
jgi:hypothetical protein